MTNPRGGLLHDLSRPEGGQHGGCQLLGLSFAHLFPQVHHLLFQLRVLRWLRLEIEEGLIVVVGKHQLALFDVDRIDCLVARRLIVKTVALPRLGIGLLQLTLTPPDLPGLKYRLVDNVCEVGVLLCRKHQLV